MMLEKINGDYVVAQKRNNNPNYRDKIGVNEQKDVISKNLFKKIELY